MHIALCPICKSMIELSKPALGSPVECPECGELFRVVKTDPLELYYQSSLEEEALPEEEPRLARG